MDRRRGLTVGTPASCRSTLPQSKKKGPRGFRRRSKSREETPRGGGATWGCRRLYLAFRKTPCIDGAQFTLAAFAMRAGRVVDAPGQSNTDTHQGVDRSLDAPSTGTGMAQE